MPTPKQLQRQQPFSVPNISDPVFQKKRGVKDMIWFIAGALRQAKPQLLTVSQIFASIEKHQPWRILECRGKNKRAAAQRNIQWILSRSPAFEHDGSGRWRLTGRPLVRTVDMLPSLASEPPPAMTNGEVEAYLEWADGLFAPFQSSDVGDLSTSSSLPGPQIPQCIGMAIGHVGDNFEDGEFLRDLSLGLPLRQHYRKGFQN